MRTGYPSKPIKLTAPVQPGGVGSLATAHAAPDGNTRMVGCVGTHGTNLAVRKLHYDAIRDLTPIVRRLNDEINALLWHPQLRERLSSEALEPMPMSPAEFGQDIRNDIARWSKFAKDRNITIAG